MQFLEWKCMNSAKDFFDVCSSWQYSSIGSNDGLAPARQEAIVWIYWRIYALLRLNELTDADMHTWSFHQITMHGACKDERYQ